MDIIKWDVNEMDRYDINRGGIVGQSGYMPQELYLLKSEQTYMYEREDLLDNHFRSTLKDRTLDFPTLAQELPRSTQNALRSDVLNIRHSAARTEAEPIHPDLFLGMTDRDARGYHNAGPDLKISNTHSMARAKYKDTISDHASDWTIPEGTRSEARVIRDLRNTIKPSIQRLKIFDTSTDSRSTHYGGSNTSHISNIPKLIMDNQVLNINDVYGSNYKANSTGYDKIQIGYRQQGDHKFSVAQYNLPSYKQYKSNIYDSQNKNQTSHKLEVSPDEVTNRMMSKMKKDVIKIGYRQIGDSDFSVAKYGRISNRQVKSDIRGSHNNNIISHSFNSEQNEIKNRLSSSILKETSRTKNIENDKEYSNPMFMESSSLKNTIGRLSQDLSTVRNSTIRTANTPENSVDLTNIKKVIKYEHPSHDSVFVDENIYGKINENKNISFINKIDYNFRNNTSATDGIYNLPGDNVQVKVYSRKNPDLISPLDTEMEHEVKDTVYEPIYKSSRARYENPDSSQTEQGQGVNPIADKVFNSFKKAPIYHQGLRMTSETVDNGGVINEMTSNGHM